MSQVNDERYAFFIADGIIATQIGDMEREWLLRELTLLDGQLNDLRDLYIETIGPLPYPRG